MHAPTCVRYSYPPVVPLLVEDDADESSAEPTDDFGAATKIDGLSPVQDLLE